MHAFLALTLLLLLSPHFARACHPECRWQSDDPVCTAVCEPKCQEPVCDVQCQVPEHASTCVKPQCWVRCPNDGCESEHCPACETVCNPYFYCSAHGAVCAPLCEETRCSWACRKPIPGKECPLPRFELQCEHPACEYSGALGVCTPMVYVVAASLLFMLTHA